MFASSAFLDPRSSPLLPCSPSAGFEELFMNPMPTFNSRPCKSTPVYMSSEMQLIFAVRLGTSTAPKFVSRAPSLQQDVCHVRIPWVRLYINARGPAASSSSFPLPLFSLLCCAHYGECITARRVYRHRVGVRAKQTYTGPQALCAAHSNDRELSSLRSRSN